MPQLTARSLPAVFSNLEFGDVAFTGNGPDGISSIGIEYKKTNDALACMTGGRFSGHQLPGMLGSYQHCWLLIEGTVRCGDDGTLQMRAWPEGWRECRQGNNYISWKSYQHWLMSLQQMANLKVAHVANLKESASWIGALYSWWSKEWSQHKSVGTVYVPPMTHEGSGPLANVVGSKATLSRLWAMQLPGVGQDRSKTVALAFPTALELATADEKRWQMVDGIGKTLATKIVNAIKERGK